MQFLAVELHGSVLETSLSQLLGQTVQRNQLRGILALIGLGLRGRRSRLPGAVYHAVLLQNVLHLFVGKAAVALDDGVGQVPVLDVGIFV